jgi:hypothetical protein
MADERKCFYEHKKNIKYTKADGTTSNYQYCFMLERRRKHIPDDADIKAFIIELNRVGDPKLAAKNAKLSYTTTMRTILDRYSEMYMKQLAIEEQATDEQVADSEQAAEVIPQPDPANQYLSAIKRVTVL